MDKKLALAVFFADGERIEIELGRDDDSRLSLTGIANGHAGQCDSMIEELAGDVPEVRAILDAWETYHLKPTPDSVFDDLKTKVEALNGQRFGQAPDVDDAPEIGGDIFNSLDVIKRLEIYREAVRFMGVPEDKLDSMNTAENWPEELENVDDDQHEIAEEFIRLREFDSQGSDYAPDWRYGETIISEDYFTEYAEEMVKDCGDMPQETPGYIAIDWEKTAENIKVDYTEIEYGGTTYLVR
jgi:hypothetical protein